MLIGGSHRASAIRRCHEPGVAEHQTQEEKVDYHWWQHAQHRKKDQLPPVATHASEEERVTATGQFEVVEEEPGFSPSGCNPRPDRPGLFVEPAAREAEGTGFSPRRGFPTRKEPASTRWKGSHGEPPNGPGSR